VPAFTVQIVGAGSRPLANQYVYDAGAPPAEGDLIRVRPATAETGSDMTPVRVRRVYVDLVIAAHPGLA
jgi:hypothetical protein